MLLTRSKEGGQSYESYRQLRWAGLMIDAVPPALFSREIPVNGAAAHHCHLIVASISNCTK